MSIIQRLKHLIYKDCVLKMYIYCQIYLARNRRFGRLYPSNKLRRLYAPYLKKSFWTID